jgi:hypothetical protein
MKNVFIIIFVLVFYFTIGNVVDATIQIYNRRVKELPRELVIPLENINIFNISKVVKVGIPWNVYSDREHNQTYMSYKAIKTFKKASFLESFYVIDEKENYLHIVKDPKLNINSELSSFAESYGCISKRNLLLWRHCLVVKESLVNQKAMVINSIDQLRQKGMSYLHFVKFRKGLEFYSSISENTFQPFQFFFIYKFDEDKKKYLLGKDPFFTCDEDVSDSIVGWAPKSHLFIWNTRIVVEPNWDKVAIKQRRNGSKAKLFVNAKSAKEYSVGKKVDSKFIVWEENETSWERPIGEWLRFPLLSIIENNLVQIAVMIAEIDNLFKHDFDIMDIENKKEEVYLIYTKLIAPIIVKGQTRPLFKRSLLLEYQEFICLLHTLYGLSISGQSHLGNERKQLYETWRKILKLHLGDKQDVNSYKLDKIHRIVIGLPSKMNSLRNVKLVDITNPRRFKSKDFNNYVKLIKDKMTVLQKIIRNDNYKYMFRSNEVRYYWISEDLLP